jgi:uncharacterized phiE125 gp8 family phage protein
VVSTDTTHDTLLARLIVAASELIEFRTGLKLTARTYRLDMDGFPDGDIELPVYPVNSVSAVTYSDSENSTVTMTEDAGSPVGDYWVSTSGMEPYIRAVAGAWPATYLDKPNSVQVTMNAGYSDPSDCPEDLRAAVLVKVKELFDNAGETIEGTSAEASINTVQYLIAPHRRYNA